MATVTATSNESKSKSSAKNPGLMTVALPYLIAVGAQLLMFMLFLRQLTSKTHYQTVWLAIIATVAIVILRWPREERIPFRESVASNVLLGMGLIMGIGSVLFVNTWFCAASVMLLVTSFLLKVVDSDRNHSLWTAALPLFVFLPLPFRWDTTLITTLQRQSAWLTSRLLDLLGLGHFLDGTQIHVPGKPGYGIEEACSGVQSFFTLLFITVVMMVVFRRIKTNLAGGTVLAILGILSLIASLLLALPFMLYVGIAFILWGLLGLRAMALIYAAVFWAMFINVLRILLIPVLDVNGVADLTSGFGHVLLGWGALAIGLALLLSTDQLLLFLFGPVDPEMGESGPFGKLITKFWNQLVSGQEELESSKKKKRRAVPVAAGSTRLAWIVAAILAVGGIFQLTDVARGFSETNKVQFFDADITQAMKEGDLPKQLENWALVENSYEVSTRDHGSDLGRRSDAWQFRAPNCKAIVSFDQTFPGWHELTTCYRNSGWTLDERVVIKPEVGEGEKSWDIVEAKFSKTTGERGYLLFSHFNGAGEPESAPVNIGTLESFLTRAKNRLSNRVRRSLFSSETYQVQAMVQHYGVLDSGVEQEIQDRFVQAREILRQKFLERNKGNAAETPEAE